MRLRPYRGTLLLLLVLAALGAFVYFYEARGPAEAQNGEQEAQVWSVAEEDIKGIELRDGEKSVSLARDADGAWQVVAPEQQPADEWAVTTLLWRIAHLNADRIVDDKIEDPAAYGLDTPRLELRLTLADGSQAVMYLGSENPRATGSYARREGADTLYLVNASLVSDLRKLVAEPPKALPTPAATTSPDGGGEATPNVEPSPTPTP